MSSRKRKPSDRISMAASKPTCSVAVVASANYLPVVALPLAITLYSNCYTAQVSCRSVVHVFVYGCLNQPGFTAKCHIKWIANRHARSYPRRTCQRRRGVSRFGVKGSTGGLEITTRYKTGESWRSPNAQGELTLAIPDCHARSSPSPLQHNGKRKVALSYAHHYLRYAIDG